mmetsp:Transcript_62430/g.122842  ORF Transcript_62430/g.122842 Transcript_62430/m.122842 type:complete len:2323 (-) Transcript_62430:80-7048(-)
MTSSLVQLKSILWKNWLLKKAHFSGLMAEILLPVIFMALLIMIKNLTSVYNSPSIAYYCGNAYPWFYTSTIGDIDNNKPLTCLQQPDTCDVDNYYKDEASFKYNNDTLVVYSQYGYVSTATSSGAANSPFYTYTIGDKSDLYNIGVEEDDYLQNPSLPLCTILSNMAYQRVPAILAVAPASSNNAELTNTVALLRRFILDQCSPPNTFSNTVHQFDSQSSVESYITDKHYDDEGYKYGKVGFAIILNALDTAAVQWDYSIRANYTSFFDQDDKTVACLYRGNHCDFTYTIPSTKFYTQDLYKPQSMEFQYGYTYSGFSTLQQTVDQFIFAMHPNNAANAHINYLSDSAPHSSNSSSRISSVKSGGDRIGIESNSETAAGLEHSSLSAFYPNLVNIMASVSLMPTSAYKTDDFQYIISSTLGIFYMLSFLYPVSRIIRALVLEKETRIKEGMKMMGLPDSVYNLSWLITTVLQMTLVSLLITLVTASSVFEYSNKLFVFLYFEAFSLAVINMCFLLSTFFSRSKSASLLGPMIFFASFFPYYAVSDDQFDSSSKAATCILAPACFALGAEVFADYEGGLVGVQSSNLSIETSNFSYSLCVGMLFFDAVLYGVLAWYLDKVMPSEFGTQLPPYFPFLPSYWCGTTLLSTKAGPGLIAQMESCLGLTWRSRKYSSFSSAGGDSPEDENMQESLLDSEDENHAVVASGQRAGAYIESVSADLARQASTQSCLSIRALRKVFASAAGGSERVAVDKLNMDLYQGQVTVLLGHNGAGKTTTISMLVGLVPPTAGTAYFPGGLDIVDDMQEIRRNLGVCPQHDILFPELTVMEHLQIYASFKGVLSSEVTSAAKAMIAEVGLSEKANARSSTLSGGQKRKLSLGIALIGDSKVVILDEPTSGMDPYSRRSTWNIIQRNKKGRIILLTTHFMDEADLLGDRVAIMAHGKLQCFGSPLFLKNKFGVGYTLTIVKTQPEQDAAPITAEAAKHNFVERSKLLHSIVKLHIPHAESLSDVGAEQSFRLPFTASGKFVELFTAFDQQKETLGIAEYGISVTTLEEVFIRVGEMEESINESAEAAEVVNPTPANDSPAVVSTANPSSVLSPLTLSNSHSAPALHGILHHSDPRGRARSMSSENPRSSTTSLENMHGGHHSHGKRVSFRDGGEDIRTDLAGLQIMPHPPPIKEEVELHVERVVSSSDSPRRRSSDHAHAHAHTSVYSLSPEEKMAQASGTPHTGGLFCAHFSALLAKRAIYAKRDRRMIFCQLILPVFLVLLGVTILLIKPGLNQPSLVLSAKHYNPDLHTAYRNFVPFSIDGSDEDSFPAKIQERFNGNPDDGVYGTAVPIVDLGSEDEFDSCSQGPSVLYNVSQYVLKSVDDPSTDAEKGSSRYGAITIAADTNETNLNYNIMVNGSAIHGVGVYVNLIHQAFLQVVTGTSTATITARNYPLPETYKQKNEAATADAFVVALFAMIAFCFIPASFAVFIVKEREVKAKHQQVISGVSIYAYWISTYLWDVVSYLPTAGLVILVVFAYGVTAYTTGAGSTAFALLLLLYGPATAAFTYLTTFVFSSHSTAQIVVMFTNFITGLCLVVVSFVLTTIPSTTAISPSLRYLFRIFPSFCMGDGIIQLALCTDGSSCPTIGSDGYNFDSSQSPLAWDMAGADLVFLLGHGIFYFAFTVIIEYGLTFPALMSWLYDADDQEAEIHERLLGAASSGGAAGEGVVGDYLEEDEDVAAERVRVMSGAADGEVVRIQQLRKIYPVNSKAGGFDPFVCFRYLLRHSINAVSALKRTEKQEEEETLQRNKKGNSGRAQNNYKVAVQSLCFGIPKGQCFGFLGINGAGKTTTLSILSGEFPPTSGEAYIDGFSIRDDQSNIRRRIGYCPQFDALLELLTVREHLELYGRIKGFAGAGLEAIVRGKLVQLDLKDFEHKTAGSLSGGNKRKLSVAVATIGEPSIVFLDEPSTGMDPVARRFMWKVIARMTTEDAQCSVILTTHSMEEAEALCSRIGVMVNGRLRCLGPAQHLKLRFGNGFEVNIKLKSPTQTTLGALLQRALGSLRAYAQAEESRRSRSQDGRSSFSGNLLTSMLSPAENNSTRVAPALTVEELTEAPCQHTHSLSSAEEAQIPLFRLDEMKIRLCQVSAVCEGLGRAGRAVQIAPFQSGAQLYETFLTEPDGIPLRMFLEWWLVEDAAEQLQVFMRGEFGTRAQLLERSTAQNFRYRVHLAEAEISAESTTHTAGEELQQTTNSISTDSASEGQVQQHSTTSSSNMQNALSDIFAKFETHKEALNILEYSVGQTTLEQIFNQFASQQDNPEVQAATAAAAASAAASIPQ